MKLKTRFGRVITVGKLGSELHDIICKVESGETTFEENIDRFRIDKKAYEAKRKRSKEKVKKLKAISEKDIFSDLKLADVFDDTGWGEK